MKLGYWMGIKPDGMPMPDYCRPTQADAWEALLVYSFIHGLGHDTIEGLKRAGFKLGKVTLKVETRK